MAVRSTSPEEKEFWVVGDWFLVVGVFGIENSAFQ